jgi:uncharacterized protein YdhG (YjbR/CyaY superfamily)
LGIPGIRNEGPPGGRTTVARRRSAYLRNSVTFSPEVYMQIFASSVDDYIDKTDPKWRDIIVKLRAIIKENIQPGFEETVGYGMIGYVVPHSIYPQGYRVNPKDPLPFINLAAQKKYVALYHMGLYGNEKIKAWFIEEYERQFGRKLDMGKGCMRFTREEIIPYELIKELVKKITVGKYIENYTRLLGTGAERQ